MASCAPDFLGCDGLVLDDGRPISIDDEDRAWILGYGFDVAIAAKVVAIHHEYADLVDLAREVLGELGSALDYFYGITPARGRPRRAH